MAEPHFIGIEIGGTKLQLVLATASLYIIDEIILSVNQKEGAKGIRQQVEDSIRQLQKTKSLSAVGVGFGGPVHTTSGLINTSHQIEGWDNFNIKEWLQAVTGVPVFVDNDANVAALGEGVHGAGASYNIVFYMTIGSGIGGGLVVNKQLYHGAFPGEAEVGHLRINKQGQTLESLCSGWAVDQQVKAAVVKHPDSLLAKLAGRAATGRARFLKEASEGEDATAVAILKETTDTIAFALSHVVHLFHPDVIIIGGGLSFLGDDFRKRIAGAMPKYILQSFLPAPAVKIAALGKNVVPVGALELARGLYNTQRE